ncbi:MAG: DMT family transporter [Patescibacteria group bacterium]
MKSKLPFLLQGLFVVFIWSASKIILKMGLEEIPPYFFAAVLQLVVLVVLLIYMWFEREKYSFKISVRDKYLMVLAGAVGYGGATLFVMIGLQYVTGATAGLVAATSVLFTLLMSGILVKEKPRLEQYLGVVLVATGLVIFLGHQVLGGTLLGVALLILAEVGYAFNNSVGRIIAKAHTDNVTLPLMLIGNGVAAMVLVPIGLLTDGMPAINWDIRLVVSLVVVALIFAFGGLIWGNVLDKLKVLEASILDSTMIIQVAILSVIFLHESLTAHNIYGGLLVLLGALIVDGRLIFPRIFGLKMV